MFTRTGNSDEFGIDMGVPQGSTLGALLLIIFMNDLPNWFDKGQLTIFADNTSVAIATETTSELSLMCQTLINTFFGWCRANAFDVNIYKTE